MRWTNTFASITLERPVSTPVILTKKRVISKTLRFCSPRFKSLSRSNWTAAMHKDEMDQYICVNQFWKPPVSRSSSGFLCRVALGHILSDWTKWLHITQQNFLYHYLSVCWKRYLQYKTLNVGKSVVHFFVLPKKDPNLTVINLPEFLKYS